MPQVVGAARVGTRRWDHAGLERDGFTLSRKRFSPSDEVSAP